MKFAQKIFERATVKGVADYLLYGMVPERDNRSYESRLNDADRAYEKVARHYDEDGASVLLSAANTLVNEHTSVYMELGLQAGFLLLTDLFHNICHEKEKVTDNPDSFPMNYPEKSNPESAEPTGKTILQQFIRARMDTALEETLRKDRKYQDTQLNACKKREKLERDMFTTEQWNLIEEALEEGNASASEYGRVAYQQGLMDILDFLADVWLQKRQ